MRHLLALLLLSPLFAWAQPSCIPGVYGPQFPGSKTHLFIRGDAGWYGWGWCARPDGSPDAMYRLCAHGECASDLGALVGRTMATLGAQLIGKTPEEVYGGWWVANPPVFTCDGTLPGGTPRGNACNELVALLAKDKPAWTPPVVAPPPKTYTHAVKPNGAAVDRPIYTLSGTTLTLLSKGRAVIGQNCDTTRPTKASGSDLYAEFGPDFKPGVVALCSSKPTS